MEKNFSPASHAQSQSCCCCEGKGPQEEKEGEAAARLWNSVVQVLSKLFCGVGMMLFVQKWNPRQGHVVCEEEG